MASSVVIISVLVSRHSWTHWGWVTHICVGNLTIIGSDNGLSPGRRQAIIWTNAAILLIEIQTFSFMKIHLEISSAYMAATLPRPQFVNRLNFRSRLLGKGIWHVLWTPGATLCICIATHYNLMAENLSHNILEEIWLPVLIDKFAGIWISPGNCNRIFACQ